MPDYLDPQTIGGVDLYAYCNNNPVMNKDPKGNAWYNIVWNGINTIAGLLNPISTMTALGGLAVAVLQGKSSDIVDDFKNGCLNPFNQSEEVVLKSKVLSFYKGSTVVRHNISGATSCGIFGTIFLNKNTNDVNNSKHIDTVKHEWGHNNQEKILGASYLIFVALPSLYYNQTGDYRDYDEPERSKLYYSKIWERTADWLGGVDRQNYYDFWDWRNFVPW